MDSTFDDRESLLRAVFPQSSKPKFWENGRLSSAALKDAKGLSVYRTYDRTISDTVNIMKSKYSGLIVSISVPACRTANAFIKYCPSLYNEYHSEIHGSETSIVLSDEQALYLARQAIIVYEPNSPFLV